MKVIHQGGSHRGNHGDKAPDGQPAGDQPGAVKGEVYTRSSNEKNDGTDRGFEVFELIQEIAYGL